MFPTNPLKYHLHGYWKLSFRLDLTHWKWKWWFSIVVFVYQGVVMKVFPRDFIFRPGPAAWSCSLPTARWNRWADLEVEDIAAGNLVDGTPVGMIGEVPYSWHSCFAASLGRFWDCPKRMVLMESGVDLREFFCFCGCPCKNESWIKCVDAMLENISLACILKRMPNQFQHKFSLHIESTMHLQSEIPEYDAAIMDTWSAHEKLGDAFGTSLPRGSA